MTTNDVKELAANGTFQGKPLQGTIEETHISWVLLTRSHAFKIKKPVRLSFLNFSTLQRRKHFCEREVQLNGRFTDIYQGIIPVRFHNESWTLGSGLGRVVDYAVQMKRQQTTKRMDHVLRSGNVGLHDLKNLARTVAAFHKRARRVYTPFNLERARNTFNDISLIRSLVRKQLGRSFGELISQSIKWSNRFLAEHADRMQQRIDAGFKRDVHGDLHCGNIFLYRNPVLFDCIEFNEQYRQIDVLYEVAFLCMDLERFHKKDLSYAFLEYYIHDFHCSEVEEDKRIVVYYKCLRANIRAKVHAMSAALQQDKSQIAYHAAEVRRYLTLMKGYINE